MRRYFFLFASLLLLLSSCGSNREEGLLRTVPRDTPMFGLVNLKSLSSKLDSDGKRQLRETVDRLAKSGTAEARWEYFFSEGSEVDFTSPMAVFELDRACVFTFYVKNVGKFKKGIEEATGSQFSVKGNVAVCAGGTVFLSGNQVWYAPEYPEVTPEAVARVAALKEPESVLSLECCRQVEGRDEDAAVIVDLAKAYSFDREMRLTLNMLFDDASYLVSYLDFGKEKAEMRSVFLNYKCRPVPFVLRSSKIDVGRLRGFEGAGNAFAAMSVKPELAHSVVSQLKNFFPVPADVQSFVEELDGDVAVALSRRDGGETQAVSAMLTFRTSQAASDCALFLSGLHIDALPGASAVADGKKCLFSAGVPSGSPMGSLADSFKGACLGVVALPSFLTAPVFRGLDDHLDNVSLMFKDNGEGSEVLVTVATRNGADPLVLAVQALGRL